MDLISIPSENKIAIEFFRGYTNTIDVSKKLYPNSFIKEKGDKIKTVGAVTRAFSRWNKLGYIEERIKMINKKSSKGNLFKYPKRVYRLKIDPFFDYAKEKIKKVRDKEEEKWINELKRAINKDHKNTLNDLIKIAQQKEFDSVEKKILKYIFDFPESRDIVCKYNNIFDGIIQFLEKIFFYKGILNESVGMEFIRGFFVENKRYIKKYEDLEEQFEEFWKVAIKHAQDLYNKIRILSNFNENDYYDLKFKTPLKKYSAIPFTLGYKTTPKVKKDLLKRFSIVFYEKREVTNDEMLEAHYNNP